MRQSFIFKWTSSFGRTVWGTIRQVRESDVGILAGSLSFGTVISLVPLLAVSLSIFSALGGFESLLDKIEPFIYQNLVEASGAEVSRYIRRAIRRIHSGALGLGGLVGLLLASTKLFHDIETAVHRVWRLKPNRSILRRLIVYWFVMFIGPVILAAWLGLVGSRDVGLLKLLPKEALTIAFAFVALLSIYKLVPSRPVSVRSALISASVATIAVGLTQGFYAQITRKILRYSKVYGSIASVPIFLLWILILWWICLVGVALCATLERERERSLQEPSIT